MTFRSVLSGLLRILFVMLVAYPIVRILIGINVRHRNRLPVCGPAIIAANHNSHLDTLTLLTLFPLRQVPRVRPVAAADYFLRNRWLAWLSLNVIGIIPITRTVRKSDPLSGCYEALDRGEILVIFPEGTRGEPEKLGQLKSGIAHLAERYPQVPVVPVYMHGLGQSLPKGTALLVPFFCDVYVGRALHWSGDRRSFMADLQGAFEALRQKRASAGENDVEPDDRNDATPAQ